MEIDSIMDTNWFGPDVSSNGNGLSERIKGSNFFEFFDKFQTTFF